jgi:hypothetical protein
MDAASQDLADQMLSGIAAARCRSPDQLAYSMAAAPLLAKQATDASRHGLIDGLAYLDQVSDLESSALSSCT